MWRWRGRAAASGVLGLSVVVGTSSILFLDTEPVSRNVPVRTPAEAAKEILIHGPHGPVSDKLYKLEYTGTYDRKTRNAAWVAEKLTKASLEKPDTGGVPDRGKSRFIEDQSIPLPYRAKLGDYVGSGYDRGHLIPAADVVSSQSAVDETFLLTNIAPQYPSFNRGVWSSFERYVRNLVHVFDEVYVVTGPLYLPKLESDGLEDH